MFFEKKRNSYSLNYGGNITVIPALTVVTFDRIVNITSVGIKQLSATTATYRIFGDEFGPKLVTSPPLINAIYYNSHSVLIGTGTINEISNSVLLSQNFPVQYFLEYPWRTRKIYLQPNQTGNFTGNVVYY
jgi:hypothetical protein